MSINECINVFVFIWIICYLNALEEANGGFLEAALD